MLSQKHLVREILWRILEQKQPANWYAMDSITFIG
jgi:hypothetical protein